MSFETSSHSEALADLTTMVSLYLTGDKLKEVMHIFHAYIYISSKKYKILNLKQKDLLGVQSLSARLSTARSSNIIKAKEES